MLGLAFMAGLIDAVVGGGGLVQIPALFGFLPNSSPALVFGTNKFASIAGTTVAAARYARSVPIHWEATLPAAVSAFGFSFLGARAVSALSTEIVRPLVLALLVVAAIFTYVRKDFGTIHAPRHEGLKEKFYAVGLGGAIGFYDGFFGPGTGSFLIFLFIRFFGFGFLAASAAAKVVNVATNLAALAYFGFSDSILVSTRAAYGHVQRTRGGGRRPARHQPRQRLRAQRVLAGGPCSHRQVLLRHFQIGAAG